MARSGSTRAPRRAVLRECAAIAAAESGRSRGSTFSARFTMRDESNIHIRHERREPLWRSGRPHAVSERTLTDDELVEDEAERVDVGFL